MNDDYKIRNIMVNIRMYGNDNDEVRIVEALAKFGQDHDVTITVEDIKHES